MRWNEYQIDISHVVGLVVLFKATQIICIQNGFVENKNCLTKKCVSLSVYPDLVSFFSQIVGFGNVQGTSTQRPLSKFMITQFTPCGWSTLVLLSGSPVLQLVNVKSFPVDYHLNLDSSKTNPSHT